MRQSHLSEGVALRRRFGALLLGLVAICWSGPALAAQVISVGDGDTLTVMDSGRRVTVRLACIDAPETAQKPYGMEARTALQSVAPVGSEVVLRVSTRDRYGRTVAEVLRGGSNVNLSLVRDGRAFVYRQYLGGCDRNAYLGAEAQAEKARRGVWSVPGGVTRPWDWRRGGSSSVKPRGSSGSPKPASGGRYRCMGIGHLAQCPGVVLFHHLPLPTNKEGYI